MRRRKPENKFLDERKLINSLQHLSDMDSKKKVHFGVRLG